MFFIIKWTSYWELPVLKIATVYMYVCIIKAAHIYRTFLFGILETLIANICAVFPPVFYCLNKKFCTVYKQTNNPSFCRQSVVHSNYTLKSFSNYLIVEQVQFNIVDIFLWNFTDCRSNKNKANIRAMSVNFLINA